MYEIDIDFKIVELNNRYGYLKKYLNGRLTYKVINKEFLLLLRNFKETNFACDKLLSEVFYSNLTITEYNQKINSELIIKPSFRIDIFNQFKNIFHSKSRSGMDLVKSSSINLKRQIERRFIEMEGIWAYFQRESMITRQVREPRIFGEDGMDEEHEDLKSSSMFLRNLDAVDTIGWTTMAKRRKNNPSTSGIKSITEVSISTGMFFEENDIVGLLINARVLQPQELKVLASLIGSRVHNDLLMKSLKVDYESIYENEFQADTNVYQMMFEKSKSNSNRIIVNRSFSISIELVDFLRLIL